MPCEPNHAQRAYKSSLPRNPYLRIRVNGREAYVHRLVWEQANGPIPKGCVIHHIDGDYRHNELANLACMTRTAHTNLHLNDEAGRLA